MEMRSAIQSLISPSQFLLQYMLSVNKSINFPTVFFLQKCVGCSQRGDFHVMYAELKMIRYNQAWSISLIDWSQPNFFSRDLIHVCSECTILQENGKWTSGRMIFEDPRRINDYEVIHYDTLQCDKVIQYKVNTFDNSYLTAFISAVRPTLCLLCSSSL